MRISDLNNPEAARRFIQDFKKRLSRKECMAPGNNCKGKIISAHTLSVEGMLRPIATDGHVYTFRFNEFTPSDGEPLTIDLKGIRQTSVFNGFCEFHDSSLFAPIETEAFTCQPRQLFMHAYRTVAREVYLKRRMGEDVLKSVEAAREIHGIPPEADVLPSPELLSQAYYAHLGEQEFVQLKANLDDWLQSASWRRLVTTVVPLRKPAPFTCSFVFAPDFDFNGEMLQDHADPDTPLSHLCVTVLPSAPEGFVLLSHLDTGSAAPRRLVETLTKRSDFTSSLVWMMLCHCENFAISPSWLDSQSEFTRNRIREIFVQTSNPFARASNMLRECNLALEDLEPERAFVM